MNGGNEPGRSRWLELCLRRILEFTQYPDYHIFIWNNDVGAVAPHRLTQNISRISLIDADPHENLAHPHAEGPQRLYETAKSLGLR